MREIKFRAWDGERMLPPEDLSVSPGGRRWLGHVDVLLLQFTGLTDHTGREIYEGDILKDFMAWGDTEFREVFWGDGEWRLDREFTLSLFHCLDDGDHEYVVAGNIYEHSYLLDK